jgi:hypothetical protein
MTMSLAGDGSTQSQNVVMNFASYIVNEMRANYAGASPLHTSTHVATNAHTQSTGKF